MYLDWFRARFPNHPLAKCKKSKELVMQSLRNIQGTKDTDFEWNQLLAKIFTDLGWKPNTICKGVWVYLKNNQTTYLTLATNDILYMSKHEEPLKELLDKFGDFFSFKVKRGIELQFLNFRIIQSEHGISIDQTNHIIQSIINGSFDKDEKVKYESSPFPLDSKFEYELYAALPKFEDELEKSKKKYNGKYNKWTDALQHIAVWSRQDISHVVMRLSGYNAAPSLPCWKVLDHIMRYLFHKPHVPITYPRKKVEENKIIAHHAKGDGEITDLKNVKEHTRLKMYANADLAKDITTRRLVTNVVHKYNGVAFAWKIIK